MRRVRVRPASEGGPCAVQHPVHGQLIVPNPSETYDANDPLVRAFPWLFVDITEAGSPAPVEQATKAPGEKRAYTRRNR